MGLFQHNIDNMDEEIINNPVQEYRSCIISYRNNENSQPFPAYIVGYFNDLPEELRISFRKVIDNQIDVCVVNTPENWLNIEYL